MARGGPGERGSLLGRPSSAVWSVGLGGGAAQSSLWHLSRSRNLCFVSPLQTKADSESVGIGSSQSRRVSACGVGADRCLGSRRTPPAAEAGCYVK